MPRIRIKAYRPGSRSAYTLSRNLDALRLRDPSEFKGRSRDLIINWGCKTLPSSILGRSLSNQAALANKAAAVDKARDKLLTFSYLSSNDFLRQHVVSFTERKDAAQVWLEEGHVVIVRTSLTGQGGSGIVVIEPGQELPDAPLYTKYFKRRAEFRIHATTSVMPSVPTYYAVQKLRRPEREYTELETRIRTHSNGWIFGTPTIQHPETITEAANISKIALAQLGLDFGAVDIGWNERYNKFGIFEVNTAPGLKDTRTIAFYTGLFTKYKERVFETGSLPERIPLHVIESYR